MHVPQRELADRLAEAGKKIQIGGRCYHYKNPDQTYTVVDVAIMEADDSVCVIYQAEYGERVSFVRPLASWLETVEVDGRPVPRFKAKL